MKLSPLVVEQHASIMGVERIILVVRNYQFNPDNNNENEEDLSYVESAPNNPDTEGHIKATTPEEQRIVNIARNKAKQQRAIIKNLNRKSDVVVVDKESLKEKTEALARAEIYDRFPEADTDKFDAYVTLYTDAFIAECNKILQDEGVDDEIATAKQQRLWDIARGDRAAHTTSPLGGTALDRLATLRAVIVENWSIDDACTRVEELDVSISLYKKFYSGTRQEVWPDPQATF